MMQGFYLLAMQQARRRTLLAALACLAAMISLVLAGRALLSAPAVPASAAISYTVQSENDRLVIRQSDGSVLRTGIDTRCHPLSSRHLRTALRSITQRSWRGCWKITARKTPSPFPSPYSVCHRRKKFSCEFCTDKALLFLLFVLCCK